MIGAPGLGGVTARVVVPPTLGQPKSTNIPKTFTGSALAWLTSLAHPLNKTLNEDQAIIVQASRAGTETDASAFFSHLASRPRNSKGTP